MCVDQKNKLEKLISYEIGMFNDTCREFGSFHELNQFYKNLLIESFALHVRVLIDFFYCDDRKYKDDLIAQDLLPPSIIWKDNRPGMPVILEEAKRKADKQLAHLSTDRIKLESENKNGWQIVEIKREMDKVIDSFLNLRS